MTRYMMRRDMKGIVRFAGKKWRVIGVSQPKQSDELRNELEKAVQEQATVSNCKARPVNEATAGAILTSR